MFPPTSLLRPKSSCLTEQEKASAEADIIFPLLFPRRALIGGNHRALVDAQQLRISLVHFKRAALLCPAGVAVTLLRLVREVGEGVKNINQQEGVG